MAPQPRHPVRAGGCHSIAAPSPRASLSLFLTHDDARVLTERGRSRSSSPPQVSAQLPRSSHDSAVAAEAEAEEQTLAALAAARREAVGSLQASSMVGIDTDSFKQFKDDQEKWRQLQELLGDSDEEDGTGALKSQSARFRQNQEP